MNSDFFKGLLKNVRYDNYSKLIEGLYIPAIIDSFQRLKNIPQISNLIENKIRNNLVYDLENNNPILKPFLQNNILKLTKENTILISPAITKRTDIEFFISLYGEFVVECKSLRSAEQRYIDEGVARFTSEFYSKNNSEAGMIGFIVNGPMDKIMDGLIMKVQKHQLVLNSNYRLKQNCVSYIHSFHSEHNRITKNSILIHHLLIYLC
jgi:hypothetical protein